MTYESDPLQTSLTAIHTYLRVAHCISTVKVKAMVHGLPDVERTTVEFVFCTKS